MSFLVLATLSVFPAFMAYAAASDLITMKISNRVTLGLLTAFPVFALVCQLPLEAVGWHVGAGALVLAVTFAMFAAGWIGGGDAKLAAATAVWLGPDLLFIYLLLASIAGGVLTLALLNIRTYPLPGFAQWPWLVHLHAPRTGIPYGIALAIAGLSVFPESPLWKAAAAFG
jgi:prepilin peptidase CpaA